MDSLYRRPRFNSSTNEFRQRNLESTPNSSLSLSPSDLKSNISELKSSLSEMKNLNFSSSLHSNYNRSISNRSNFMKRNDSSSLGNLESSTDESNHPIVTSPGSEMNEFEFSDNESGNGGGGSGGGLTSPNLVSSSKLSGGSSSLYEERKSSVKTIANSNGSDLSFAAEKTEAACQSFVDSSGILAEKASGMKTQSRLYKTGDRLQAESCSAALSGSKVISSGFTAEKLAQASQRSSLSSNGSSFSSASHQSSSQKMSVFSSSSSSSILNSSQLSQMMKTKLTLEQLDKYFLELDDLDDITPTTNIQNVQKALVKYCGVISNTVDAMKKDDNSDNLNEWMSKVNKMMTKAWKVPSFGYEIGNTLCDIMRNNGGLDILIDNCVAEHKALQFNSAKFLQQCLVTENRGYVVEKGLKKVVMVAKKYSNDFRDSKHSRVGTGILEYLFKHSEDTCGEVIALGGLDTVVAECKSTDVETLRHCASALANVAIYGGAENQEAMIKRKIPFWLFPLAFHSDDTIKYYACLAIAVLVANKEIEAAVQKSGALELIEPFVQNHTPLQFAEVSAIHSHGQSRHWLQRLIPVLLSEREEARNLAAFHFSMEAEIKKQQGKLDYFREIGAIESLKKVASSPSGLAAKFAAQTLRTVGEDVPYKLSQQVPTWTVEDVKEWVKQIGFSQFAPSFYDSRVDGDLLLQLNEEMLREDIQMRNGILRRRFLRELMGLKRKADYSSCDATGLNTFLTNLGSEYSVYTYELLNAGIDRNTLMTINEEQLLSECGIKNKIQRLKILKGIKVERGEFSTSGDKIDKNLDVFISYRRSNGSQLASLLKVHLDIRNYSVFLDVDRLEAGKFDNNLLQSIRSAKNFILVLTPSAMDRCFHDFEQRDWIHKEIACAIQSDCNIIPVFDNFVMPDPIKLPETMRGITNYNGVKWIHDYQDACVDKIDRFMRGETNFSMMDRFLNSQSPSVSGSRQNHYNRSNSQDNSICSEDNTSGKE